MKVKQFY